MSQLGFKTWQGFRRRTNKAAADGGSEGAAGTVLRRLKVQGFRGFKV